MLLIQRSLQNTKMHCVGRMRNFGILNVVMRKYRIDWALTLKLLTTTIVAPPSNASKWQMGFNSAFKGLKCQLRTSVS